jgi:hypothetical protein
LQSFQHYVLFKIKACASLQAIKIAPAYQRRRRLALSPPLVGGKHLPMLGISGQTSQR